MQILAVGEKIVLRRAVDDGETFALTLNEAIRLADASRTVNGDLVRAIQMAKSHTSLERAREKVRLENRLAELKGLA